MYFMSCDDENEHVSNKTVENFSSKRDP